jgi:hypothetical protein
MKEFSTEDMRKMFTNPFYCINLHESLFGEHEPIIDKKTWVEANTRLILEDENGHKLKEDQIESSVKENLYRLLDVLEGNGIYNEDK